MKRFVRILGAGIVFAILGAGIGFFQGYAAFAGQPTELRMGFGGWAAWTGCIVAIPTGLLALLFGGKKADSIEWWGTLIAVIAVIGIVSAWLLAKTIGDGWISWFVTPIAALIAAAIPTAGRNGSTTGKTTRRGT